MFVGVGDGTCDCITYISLKKLQILMRNVGRKTDLEFILELVKKFVSHHEKDLCRKQCDTELTHIKQTKSKKDILKIRIRLLPSKQCSSNIYDVTKWNKSSERPWY